MADALVQYNPIAAACRTLTPCLWQAAGHVNDDPAAQLSSCQSLFGFPQVATVTLAADPIFSTAIETSTYTDIIVATSTVYSTVEQVSTSYETAYATATEYTTTATETLTVTVSAAAVSKRGVKRRRGCKLGTTLSSAVPSETSASASSSETSASPSSSADACADLAVHSSACACLEPATVTSYYDAVTSIIYATEPATVTSTSDTVITVAVTTVVVKPATTTLTSTLSTQTETTTTATATATPAAPATFTLAMVDGANAGKSVVLVSSGATYTLSGTASGTAASLSLSAGTLSLLSDSTYRAYIRLSTTSYGVIFLATQSYVSASAYTWLPLTCTVDPSTLLASCSTTSGLNRFLSCGAYLYFANPTTTPSGCFEVHLQAVKI